MLTRQISSVYILETNSPLDPHTFAHAEVIFRENALVPAHVYANTLDWAVLRAATYSAQGVPANGGAVDHDTFLFCGIAVHREARRAVGSWTMTSEPLVELWAV